LHFLTFSLFHKNPGFLTFSLFNFLTKRPVFSLFNKKKGSAGKNVLADPSWVQMIKYISAGKKLLLQKNICLFRKKTAEVFTIFFKVLFF
jgi:hypothetical protein